jgi:hypothetical protein
VCAPPRDLGETVVEQRGQHLAVELARRDRSGPEPGHHHAAALTERTDETRLPVFRLVDVRAARRTDRNDGTTLTLRRTGEAYGRAEIHHRKKPVAGAESGPELAHALLGLGVVESRSPHAFAHATDVDLDADAVIAVDLRRDRGRGVATDTR